MDRGSSSPTPQAALVDSEGLAEGCFVASTTYKAVQECSSALSKCAGMLLEILDACLEKYMQAMWYHDYGSSSGFGARNALEVDLNFFPCEDALREHPDRVTLKGELRELQSVAVVAINTMACYIPAATRHEGHGERFEEPLAARPLWNQEDFQVEQQLGNLYAEVRRQCRELQSAQGPFSELTEFLRSFQPQEGPVDCPPEVLALYTQGVKTVNATLADASRYVTALRANVLEAHKHRLLILRTNNLPPAPGPLSGARTPSLFVRWRWHLQLQSLAETAAGLAPATEAGDKRPSGDMSLAIAQSARKNDSVWGKSAYETKATFNIKWEKALGQEHGYLPQLLRQVQRQDKCRLCYIVTSKDNFCCSHKTFMACLACTRRNMICDIVTTDNTNQQLQVTRLRERDGVPFDEDFPITWAFLSAKDVDVERTMLEAYYAPGSRTRCMHCVFQGLDGCKKLRNIASLDREQIEGLKGSDASACQHCEYKYGDGRDSSRSRCKTVWRDGADGAVCLSAHDTPKPG